MRISGSLSIAVMVLDKLVVPELSTCLLSVEDIATGLYSIRREDKRLWTAK